MNGHGGVEIATGSRPPWLRKRLAFGDRAQALDGRLTARGLHTICREACCPNQGECFSNGVATFLILGDVCTRDCRFCAVKTGRPLPVDPDEPQRLAEEVSRLGLRFVVVTSVTRDDLPDGGSGHFAETIRAVHLIPGGVDIEVLIPDFGGSEAALRRVVDAGPEVINHNVETVPRLYPEVRPQADYHRSLFLLRSVREMDASILTKSGLMLGLGERTDEVLSVMRDLRQAGCSLLTLGQYLRPSLAHHPVAEYLPPAAFEALRQKGLRMGFKGVAAGPFVRSSYLAREFFEKSKSKERH